MNCEVFIGAPLTQDDHNRIAEMVAIAPEINTLFLKFSRRYGEQFAKEYFGNGTTREVMPSRAHTVEKTRREVRSILSTRECDNVERQITAAWDKRPLRISDRSLPSLSVVPAIQSPDETISVLLQRHEVAGSALSRGRQIMEEQWKQGRQNTDLTKKLADCNQMNIHYQNVLRSMAEYMDENTEVVAAGATVQIGFASQMIQISPEKSRAFWFRGETMSIDIIAPQGGEWKNTRCPRYGLSLWERAERHLDSLR